VEHVEAGGLTDRRRELSGFIREVEAVVFIVSPNSIALPVCSWEENQAAKLNERLALIMLQRVSDDRIPEAIASSTSFFFDQAGNFEAQADALARLETNPPAVGMSAANNGFWRRGQETESHRRRVRTLPLRGFPSGSMRRL
jgi:hypothetical protein